MRRGVTGYNSHKRTSGTPVGVVRFSQYINRLGPLLGIAAGKHSSSSRNSGRKKENEVPYRPCLDTWPLQATTGQNILYHYIFCAIRTLKSKDHTVLTYSLGRCFAAALRCWTNKQVSGTSRVDYLRRGNGGRKRVSQPTTQVQKVLNELSVVVRYARARRPVVGKIYYERQHHRSWIGVDTMHSMFYNVLDIGLDRGIWTVTTVRSIDSNRAFWLAVGEAAKRQ